jgi:hypothetical protein
MAMSKQMAMPAAAPMRMAKRSAMAAPMEKMMSIGGGEEEEASMDQYAFSESGAPPDSDLLERENRRQLFQKTEKTEEFVSR